MGLQIKFPRFGKDARLRLALALPVALIMGGLVFLPLVSTLFYSLFRIEPMKPGTPFVGLSNYSNLLKDSTLNAAWITTANFVVLAVLIETVGGLAAALLLNRITTGRRWLLAIVVLPCCLPPVVNAIIWMWVYNPSYGLLNGLLLGARIIDTPQVWFNSRETGLLLISVFHAWRMMLLTVIILLAALQHIPQGLYEAARLEGATAWQRLRKITLPLSATGLAIALPQSTIFAVNLFDEAWILNGASLYTRSMSIQVHVLAFPNMMFSGGMALSVLTMVVSLAVSLIYVLRVYRETRFE